MARTFKARGPSAFAQAHAGALSAVAAAAPFLGEGMFRHSFEVPVAKVVPDPNQPRRLFDEDAMAELKESLKLHGQLQPILVAPSTEHDGDWEIVVGERRWRAATQLGWEKMLAIEFSGDRKAATLVENMIRADLTPAEEAQGLHDLMTAQNWSQREAAAQLGLSQARISRVLRILSLPASFLTAATGAGIPMNVLVGVAREADPDRQAALMERALAGNLTVSQVNEARGKAAASDGADSGKNETKPKLGAERTNFMDVKKVTTALLAAKSQGVALSRTDRKMLLDLQEVVEHLLRS